MTPITKTIAAATLATLAAPTLALTAAATPGPTCIITAQPQDERSYHLAYTDNAGAVHILIAAQDATRKLPPTNFEIPADFTAVHWASTNGNANGPWYDNLHNGGGCTFTKPYHAAPGWRASIIIRVGHTPATTTTSTTAAPATTTTSTTGLPPATVVTGVPTPFPVQPVQPVEPPTTTPVTPPETDVPLEEAPTTTTTEVAVPPSTVPPSSSSTLPAAVVGGDPTPVLPATGRDSSLIVAWGLGFLTAGAAFVCGGRKIRRRTYQEN